MRKHYWQTVRPWLQELLTSRMDADCAALSGAGSMNDIARRCNVVVHPYVGTYTLRGYDADWTYMKEYVRNHMQWMDQQLETTDSTISSFCMMYAKFPY